MTLSAHMWIYSLLCMIPRMGMAYVLANALTGGASRRLAAVAGTGTTTGAVFHMGAAVAGVRCC